MPAITGDVGLAFAVTCGAGLATGIGASVVFFPSLVKLASRKVLASGLAFSAGVMTYVSFVELFPNSLKSFGEVEGLNDGQAYSYGTVGFFVGVISLFIIDGLIHLCLGHQHSHDAINIGKNGSADHVDGTCAPQCVCVSDISPSQIEGWQHNAEQEIDRIRNPTLASPEDDDFADSLAIKSKDGDADLVDEKIENPPAEDVATAVDQEQYQIQFEKDQLNHMGLTTALAVALHNFPEGLATFVATLSDPRVGVLLAIAIGIHNVPEGLCVALPIYYSTGSRWKGFLWGLGSGLAEPLAALLGWLILAPFMTHTVYAILDSLIAGLMVAISTKELLPTAHRYDPKDTVVTYSYLGGMIVMALSLILFQLTV